MALLLESIATFTTNSIVVPSTVFLFGSCFLITYFVEDIATEMFCSNVNKRSDGENKQAKEHFCRIIQDIADAKQLSVK